MSRDKGKTAGKSPTSKDDPVYHLPVLLKEVTESLSIRQEGVYVDCTFGGGGHARAILEKLGEKGRLVAFDQDADAKQNVPEDSRILFLPHNFRHLHPFLRLNGIGAVDGVLADLGVSSHQFDEGSRGFSTRFEGAIDMRMDQRQDKTAFDVVNEYSEAELHKLFEQFGEVTNAKTLARTIVAVRRTASLKTIEGFKGALSGSVKGNPHKYFAQVFQALRMEVNDEMGALKELLEQLPEVLRKGGRAAIITFHSVEDRMVKVFFRDNTFEPVDPNPFRNVERPKVLKLVNRKPILASEEEVERNPRSRSAKLRVAEKV